MSCIETVVTCLASLVSTTLACDELATPALADLCSVLQWVFV